MSDELEKTARNIIKQLRKLGMPLFEHVAATMEELLATRPAANGADAVRDPALSGELEALTQTEAIALLDRIQENLADNDDIVGEVQECFERFYQMGRTDERASAASLAKPIPESRVDAVLRGALMASRPAVEHGAKQWAPWAAKIEGRVNPWQVVLDQVDAALATPAPAPAPAPAPVDAAGLVARLTETNMPGVEAFPRSLREWQAIGREAASALAAAAEREAARGRELEALHEKHERVCKGLASRATAAEAERACLRAKLAHLGGGHD